MPVSKIHKWLRENKITNEKGEPMDFYDHLFLYDIYLDQSQYLTILKAAQVGLSTCSILKNHFDAKDRKMDIIYTLPTDQDSRVFVGGKVNRIIANNPCMLADVADKDSIEQKAIGMSMIYFRGTWSKKAAIMITADRLVHDEKDSSKLDVINEYQARLQHSKLKQIHTFSHPSLPETGVHLDWIKSDQKHWFIKCPHCSKWHYLSWDTDNPKNMSIDIERQIFTCKLCGGELDRESRRNGQWVRKYRNREISGYWVPLSIAPWITAKDIVAKYKDPESTLEFFYNKVLGLPYADGSSKLLRQHFMQNLTGEPWAAPVSDRIVIGIDTGLRLDYVMGNADGLFFHGEATDYDELDRQMERWPKAIAVIDQGGDLIGARKFHARWKGRVYLCSLGGDKKTKELTKWGKGDEHGTVVVERDRAITLVIGEFRNKHIKVHGTEQDWFEYWLDWNHLTKMKILDPDTNQIKGYKWIRSGRDHKALATVFWRVGMMRFAEMGYMIQLEDKIVSYCYKVEPDQKVKFYPEEIFDLMEKDEEEDWRIPQ